MELTVLLTGDVMLGRGIDQILAHPGDPALREDYVRDARQYVGLALSAHGDLALPVDDDWPWGEAVAAADAAEPGLRIVNVETSITRSDGFDPAKGIHYRANPANIGCLAVIKPDVAVLANNHVLDLGPQGLTETLATLREAGIATAGAGEDEPSAWRPAVITPPGGPRVLVGAVALASSGVPARWAAADRRPGVAYLPDSSPRHADRVIAAIDRERRDGDLIIVSVHWGSNWGYEVSPSQTAFAHRLIDGGVAVVHGHSSHHPRPIEIYRDHLVLYGCGDLINDYEGIPGHEEYRDDLRLLYLATLDTASGRLAALRIVALRARRLRLWRAAGEDVDWLRDVLDAVSAGRGVTFERAGDELTVLSSPVSASR